MPRRLSSSPRLPAPAGVAGRRRPGARSGVVERPSRIHGTGAFATRRFAAGETVLTIDDTRVVDEAHPLRAEAGELPHHCDYLAGGRGVLMRAPERSINSSCDPNTQVLTVDGRRRVIALRPIEAGEELTYDYIVNCDGGQPWNCGCGSPRCRGRVPASFFDLPADEQRRLAPMLDEWFVEEHRARLEKLGL